MHRASSASNWCIVSAIHPPIILSRHSSGPIRAGFYQAFAALFGASLNKKYDPNGVDRLDGKSGETGGIRTDLIILLIKKTNTLRERSIPDNRKQLLSLRVFFDGTRESCGYYQEYLSIPLGENVYTIRRNLRS